MALTNLNPWRLSAARSGYFPFTHLIVIKKPLLTVDMPIGITGWLITLRMSGSGQV
jgi:hypothetical protein